MTSQSQRNDTGGDSSRRLERPDGFRLGHCLGSAVLETATERTTKAGVRNMSRPPF